MVSVFPAAGKESVSMQTTLTAKLKLMLTPEQFAALRQTQLAYRDALNLVSQYAFQPWQDQQPQTPAGSHLFPAARGLRLAGSARLQCPSPGECYVQRAVDEMAEQRGVWSQAHPLEGG